MELKPEWNQLLKRVLELQQIIMPIWIHQWNLLVEFYWNLRRLFLHRVKSGRHFFEFFLENVIKEFLDLIEQD